MSRNGNDGAALLAIADTAIGFALVHFGGMSGEIPIVRPQSETRAVGCADTGCSIGP